MRKTLFFIIFVFTFSALAVEPRKQAVTDNQPLGDNQDAHGFGALARRFKIFIFNIPVMINEGSIDEIVGKRDTLESGTLQKNAALYPRIRMEQYTYFTENIHKLRLKGPEPGDESPRGSLSSMSLDTTRASTLLENSQNTLIRHFSISELIDLTVFKLSTKNFPAVGTDAAWKRTKRLFMRYDVPLGLAVVGYMVAQDDLSFRTSGWLFQYFGDRLRVGWYVNAQDMGVHWHPTFDMGAVAATKESTLKVGVTEHPGAASSEVGRALQAKFSHYWQEAIRGGGHWEFTSNAAVKWIAESADTHQHRDVIGNVEVYARRPLEEESEYAVMMKTSAESNFTDRYSLNGGVTLENEKRHLQISMLGRISQTIENPRDLEASKADYFIGVFLGGDFIAEFERLQEVASKKNKRSLP